MSDLTQFTPSPQADRPKLRVRRYGRSDYEKFDEDIARASHLHVGSGNIGKVEVDCKYHWRKAQWGVLGSSENPAGIVFIDITLKQPRGYWLENASVFVTLSENDSSYALVKSRNRDDQQRSGSDYGVQITEHFGPQRLAGNKVIEAQTKTTNLTPSVGVMGFQLGGMGRDYCTTKEKTSQWQFQGARRTPKDGHGYRTLEWAFRADELDHKNSPCQEFSTAFAFEHRKRPVFMRVEVAGELGKKSKQIWQSVQTFSSKLGKEDKSTLTHIDLSETVSFRKNLDGLARGLHAMMERENLLKTPMEMPSSMPVNFFSTESHDSAPCHQKPIKDARFQTKIEEIEDPIILSLRSRLEDDPATESVSDETLQGTTVVEESDTSSTVRDDISIKESVGDEDEKIRELLNVPAIFILVTSIAMVARFLSLLGGQVALCRQLVMVLKAAEDLGDVNIQAGCLQQLIFHGADDPPKIVKQLGDLYLSTGNQSGYRDLLLFRYMLVKTPSDKEKLRQDILVGGQYRTHGADQAVQFKILAALATSDYERRMYQDRYEEMQEPSYPRPTPENDGEENENDHHDRHEDPPVAEHRAKPDVFNNKMFSNNLEVEEEPASVRVSGKEKEKKGGGPVDLGNNHVD
ncbi:hypothetical protein QQX98_006357 [Neonectria punicea]|uniref:Uncharacterized protein n=1 Tax=Neonectria punicea TaxID=979145 RepID=A0ABR1H1S8_9HYPO